MKKDDSDLKYREFQELYFKEYEVRISYEEAVKRADQLLRFFRAVYKRPIIRQREDVGNTGVLGSKGELGGNESRFRTEPGKVKEV